MPQHARDPMRAVRHIQNPPTKPNSVGICRMSRKFEFAISPFLNILTDSR
jgi:hypothetical protein